jgi:prepilin-type N-terminal cleavage/methylation domain-containing protein
MKKHQITISDVSGFTLVELIITISIIGIASIGIASLFYTTQYTQQQSRYIDAATRAAQRQVEILRNNSYNNLQAGQTINFTADLPSSLPNTKSGTAVVSEPSDGLKRVDVTVSFTQNGRSQNVKLSSLIGVIGISQ